MGMQGPKGIEKAIDRTSSVLMTVSTILLMVMLLLGTADVIGRYFLNHPISGTTEVFEILLPGIVLLSWGYIQREHSHITVDILYARFPPRFKAIVTLFITLLSMVIAGLIFWQGIVEAELNFQMGRMIRNIEVPQYLPMLLVPVGAFTFLLALIFDFYVSLKNIRKKG